LCCKSISTPCSWLLREGYIKRTDFVVTISCAVSTSFFNWQRLICLPITDVAVFLRTASFNLLKLFLVFRKKLLCDMSLWPTNITYIFYWYIFLNKYVFVLSGFAFIYIWDFLWLIVQSYLNIWHFGTNMRLRWDGSQTFLRIWRVGHFFIIDRFNIMLIFRRYFHCQVVFFQQPYKFQCIGYAWTLFSVASVMKESEMGLFHKISINLKH